MLYPEGVTVGRPLLAACQHAFIELVPVSWRVAHASRERPDLVQQLGVLPLNSIQHLFLAHPLQCSVCPPGTRRRVPVVGWPCKSRRRVPMLVMLLVMLLVPILFFVHTFLPCFFDKSARESFHRSLLYETWVLQSASSWGNSPPLSAMLGSALCKSSNRRRRSVTGYKLDPVDWTFLCVVSTCFIQSIH